MNTFFGFLYPYQLDHKMDMCVVGKNERSRGGRGGRGGAGTARNNDDTNNALQLQRDLSPEPRDLSPVPRDLSPIPRDVTPVPRDVTPVPREDETALFLIGRYLQHEYHQRHHLILKAEVRPELARLSA
ncbi:Hypothetical predicted protein [Mytilus galloprovincialis]|uniref:Uncharacterized protein n=1 Tax=Mytilus galloprovincialis TaxID=29158 RepID=A0A8B6EPQ2_MYTGA|nr:Hypothetical predicted protein [Mytilus galloprovincialis]